MASSLYNLALDFSKELNYTKAIMARQGDKGITVTVKPFLNGLQMDTSGGTFTLKGTTPSNRYVDSVATSVTSEEVTFSLDGTFMSEAGYYKHCYVEYRKDNQILTTQDIIFFSLGVSDISQGQADEYVSQLEELIRKYNETFDAFMAEIKGRVDSLNQQITDLTGQAKTLQDKLDALKEEISKLGNLQVMYSNSIDFGGYDYSGNPNLMRVIKASDFRRGGDSDVLISDVEYNSIRLTSQGVNRLSAYTETNIPSLVTGKTYTISAKVKVEEGTTGNFDKLRISYRKMNSGTILLYASTKGAEVGKEITIKGTGIVNYEITDLSRFYLTIDLDAGATLTGSIIVSDIKIEEGSTATPYQPNLLDAPYYLSKVALGENIADPTTVFPISTSNYLLYNKRNIENYEAGQTYTLTMKATKPATQSFTVFIMSGTQLVGTMKPVEGKADEWKLTFTVGQDAIDAGATNILQVYQYPNTSLGAVQIDWLKIEKGDTRTPNIEQYKYRGIGMRDSNNPKDYVWDLAPEYVEDNLATDVKISEITGKANNYTDGKVSEINSQLTASINEVDTTAKDAQTKANANETAIKSTNSRVNEIENIITALTKEETYLLPASIVSGGSLKFTSRGGMTVATGSFKLAKDIAFGEVLVNDLPDSMINIDNNAIGTGAVTGNSVSQIYVESNTRKVVANTAMKKDQWFTVGFSYHSKLSI
ncbi:hypothetical protein [Enterococcus faecium]|uniref:hypothetical protein n=1 Tax=Enterococcus faecium TaxID=1352 RepID=UPI00338F60A2